MVVVVVEVVNNVVVILSIEDTQDHKLVVEEIVVVVEVIVLAVVVVVVVVAVVVVVVVAALSVVLPLVCPDLRVSEYLYILRSKIFNALTSTYGTAVALFSLWADRTRRTRWPCGTLYGTIMAIVYQFSKCFLI